MLPLKKLKCLKITKRKKKADHPDEIPARLWNGDDLFVIWDLFLFGEKLNIHWGGRMNTGLEKPFGILCLAYAAWRFYRGYKKNYFR